jgi:predicted DNA-binding transcriptional regulator AlpA
MTNDLHRQPRIRSEHSLQDWSLGIQLLTAAQTIRRLSYTPAQLHLLVQRHGLPLPIDFAPRGVFWRADEIEEWRQVRDSSLISGLV